jgi:tetratricopeptide (TPR) repeat protein
LQTGRTRGGILRKGEGTMSIFGKLFGASAKRGGAKPETHGAATATKPSADSIEAGEALILAGDLDAALKMFRRMLARAEAAGNATAVLNPLFNTAYALHNGARRQNSRAGGNLYFSEGMRELDAVIAILDLLLENQPNASDVWGGLGLAYDNHGYCEKAEKCYRRAIEIDPNGADGADSWTNIGALYSNYAQTIRVRDSAGEAHEVPLAGLSKKQLYPTDDSNLAINLNLDSPHWKTAEAALERALSIYAQLVKGNPGFVPNLVTAHMNLAQYHSNRLQGAKATPHVQEAHRLQPDNQKAIEWLKEAERNTGNKLL